VDAGEGQGATMTDEAQAVAAVATTAGKVADIIRAVGAYSGDVLQTVPHDLVGLIVGDALKERRKVSQARLAAATQAKLEQIEAERLSRPSVSVVLPLLAAAADEERDELRALWASLLANAAVDGGRKVRREFFETIRGMEPADACVFQIICDLTEVRHGAAAMREDVEQQLRGTNLTLLEAQVSFEWLQRNRCVEPRGEGNRALLPYGRALMTALTVE
jgi:hypothetical protein